MWYFIIVFLVFLIICTGVQVFYMKDKLEKPDAVFGTLMGAIASIVWPLTLGISLIVLASRFFAKTYLKYSKDT